MRPDQLPEPEELLEGEATPEFDDQSRELSMTGAFGTELQQRLQDNLRQRLNIERRWVSDMRRYQGQVTDAELKDAVDQARSCIFVKYTRTKADAWAAQMNDMLFPSDDKNWGIEPTPVPSLNKLAQLVRGDTGEPTPEAQQAHQVLAEARLRAEAMEREIDDVLTECDYPAEGRRCIHYAAVLGTGILKGPQVELFNTSKYQQVEGGEWVGMIEQAERPVARNVYPWDFVPDMSGRELRDCEYVFERHYMTKKKIRTLPSSYDQKAIQKLLKLDATATHQTVDGEGLYNELRSLSGLDQNYRDRRYEVWEYHGPIDIKILQEAGVELSEEEIEMTEIDGIVIFSGDIVLKVMLNPYDTEEWPYSVFVCEPDEACIFGYGIPHLCANSQDILNTAWRQMLDNGAMAVGEQVVVNKKAVAPADGDWTLKPKKVWLATGDAATMDVQKAFSSFSINSHQQEYQNVIQLAKSFMDEESGLPMIAQGEQGQVTPTLGGMSMLMNAANAVRRAQVKEWDDNVTKPMIRRFYAWMMQFSEKPEIKGDMTIKARGTSALLVKEVQNQQVMALIQNFSQNPTLAPAFDWYEALKVLNASMSLGSTGILKEKEQYDQAIQQAQQAAQQGGDPRLEMQMQIQQMKQEHELRLQQMKAEQANQIEQMNSQQKAMMLQVQFESNASRERIEVMKLQQTKQISEEQMLMRLNEIDKNHRHDMAQFMAEIQLKQQDGLTANYGLGNE
jgi:hypothetical protein